MHTHRKKKSVVSPAFFWTGGPLFWQNPTLWSLCVPEFLTFCPWLKCTCVAQLSWPHRLLDLLWLESRAGGSHATTIQVLQACSVPTDTSFTPTRWVGSLCEARPAQLRGPRGRWWWPLHPCLTTSREMPMSDGPFGWAACAPRPYTPSIPKLYPHRCPDWYNLMVMGAIPKRSQW